MSAIPLTNGAILIKEHPMGLFAVDKPTGVKAHPNKTTGEPDCILDLPYDFKTESFLKENGESIYLLNRLDSPTSGVILLAANQEIASAIKLLFVEKKVRKTYVALVKGFLRKRKEIWRDCLGVKQLQGQVRTSIVRGSTNAETDVQVLQNGNGPPARSQLLLNPKTGKTHQLRVQCASRGLPILGDATYGDFKWNRQFKGEQRLYLHSLKTELEFRMGKNTVRFSAESPLPVSFNDVLEKF